MPPLCKFHISSKKHTPEGSPQQFCLCIDYKKLSSLLLPVMPAMSTKEDTFAFMTLLKIEELFAMLKGAKSLTTLDVHSGYYHIKQDEESIPKSVFTRVFGKFIFLRLLFGFFTRPRLLYLSYLWPFRHDKTSAQGQGSGYLAYLDDILIYRRTKKEYLQMLDKGQTQNQAEQMLVLQRTNSLFRPSSKWILYLSTCWQNWGAYET